MNDDDAKTASPFTVAHDKILKEMHTALVGNPTLGVEGLVQRQAKNTADIVVLQEKSEKHDRKFWLVSVVGGGAWASLVAFKEQIFGSK